MFYAQRSRRCGGSAPFAPPARFPAWRHAIPLRRRCFPYHRSRYEIWIDILKLPDILPVMAFSVVGNFYPDNNAASFPKRITIHTTLYKTIFYEQESKKETNDGGQAPGIRRRHSSVPLYELTFHKNFFLDAARQKTSRASPPARRMYSATSVVKTAASDNQVYACSVPRWTRAFFG